jgi:hypothetical protein
VAQRGYCLRHKPLSPLQAATVLLWLLVATIGQSAEKAAGVLNKFLVHDAEIPEPR